MTTTNTVAEETPSVRILGILGEPVAASCTCAGLLARLDLAGTDEPVWLHLLDVCPACFVAGIDPARCEHQAQHGLELCAAPAPRVCRHCEAVLDPEATCWWCGEACDGCCRTEPDESDHAYEIRRDQSLGA